MKIGIVIGRIGGVDGVALETEKWITVLNRLGHEIFICSGLYEKQVLDNGHQTLLPMLSFFSRQCTWEQSKAFHEPEKSLGTLMESIETTAKHISQALLKWIKRNKIKILLSENASALPCHLSMGLGVKYAVEESGLLTVTHDHDFAWERDGRYISCHEEINRLVDATFPLRLPNVKHAVINSAAQNAIKKGYNRDSLIVPNVMDFSKPYANLDDYNRSLLPDLGLEQDDIPLMQATRIVSRKGIENAIFLVEALNDKRIKLIITGNHEDDKYGRYYQTLFDLASAMKVSDQIIFASEHIGNGRRSIRNNKRKYSLEDAYTNARACTYFSLYEGFGNAFVESVLAKKPIFVNNYRPVYWPDIGSKGFKTVMIENNQLTKKAVAEAKEIIYNENLCREIGEHNYKLGKKYFSFEVLEALLEELF
jgi:glycosyltransferase involved in cell wall biosynthesis